MKTNIYALIHPDTKEVIYVGQTKDELTKRLNGHYWKLNEVKRGERNWTKLFHFLDNLLPNKVEIILLKEVVPANGFNLSNFYEKFYIDKYRKINPNLLNEVDGGIGGNVYKNKTKEELRTIGEKISAAIKGKKKSTTINMSLAKRGVKNPAAKRLEYPILCYDNNDVIGKFYYRFEINEFLKDKYAAGNITRSLKTKEVAHSNGYDWIYENNV